MDFSSLPGGSSCLQQREILQFSGASDVTESGTKTPSPQDLQFRACWAEVVEEPMKTKVQATSRKTSTAFALRVIDPPESLSPSRFMSSCIRQLRHPARGFQNWWDCFGLLLLIYDLIVIPRKRVFDIKTSVFQSFVFWDCSLLLECEHPTRFHHRFL